MWRRRVEEEHDEEHGGGVWRRGVEEEHGGAVRVSGGRRSSKSLCCMSTFWTLLDLQASKR